MECRYSFKEATFASSQNQIRTQNLFSSDAQSFVGDQERDRLVGSMSQHRESITTAKALRQLWCVYIDTSAFTIYTYPVPENDCNNLFTKVALYLRPYIVCYLKPLKEK